MKRIDAHQHYWHPARGDYDWMPKDNAILNRVYLPSDLTPTLREEGIAGTVLVQAAATVEETEYMLGIADATPSVLGVVGWINFEQPSHLHHLKRLANHPKFKGVRPMIQDIPDVDWMLRDDVQWGFRALCDLDLSLDALGFPQHLDNFATLLARYPDMRTVVDHCMKPQFGPDEDFDTWAAGMARLSDLGAWCKLSGLVTEAGAGWDVEMLRPYARHVIDTFGAERVMWGSDWPVCQLAAAYDDWCAAAHQMTEHYDATASARIFGGSAIEFYRLDV
ncbi:amidohydrolase [Rhodobacteraceae bacterium CCMM004]|nr:amidohydrolase [Rhodobacteraceae bacterium CCMM004]